MEGRVGEVHGLERGDGHLRVHRRREHRQDLPAGRTDSGGAHHDPSVGVDDELDQPVGPSDPAARGGGQLGAARGDAQSGVACLLLGQSYRAHLGIGERDARDRTVVGPRPVLVEEITGRDRRLVHRDVGERPLAHDVPDRPEPVARAHPLVGLDGSGLRVEPHRLQPHVGQVRTSPGRHQELVGADGLLAQRDAERALGVRHRRDRHAGQHLDALAREGGCDQRAGLGLLRCEDAVRNLEQRHPDPEPAHGLGQLRADRSAADHDQRRRQLAHLDDVAVGPVRRVGQPVDRGYAGLGARVQHDSPTRGVRRAVDLDLAWTDQPAVTAHEADPGLLEPLDGHPVVPVVGGLVTDPVGHDAPVRCDLDRPGEPGHTASLSQHIGSPDHHLRGDAAEVGTLTPDQAAVHADHLQARLGQATRERLTSRPEAHDDDIHFGALSHGFSIP
ncbi:hypothetical protein NOCA2210075 [metagenome]|uniref:Uncharacterized protein n=1 Tax=metagenome TaxID=256318 RepID=A0A2P2BY92_9ZZZZ